MTFPRPDGYNKTRKWVQIMIQNLYIYNTYTPDPHLNLAVEQYLLEHLPEESCILYLWQNKNTVVIGKNQNAWKECRTSLLEEEGGKLARRLSGGGAVFHDLGNLNFTFLVSNEDYDVDKQLQVIAKACLLAGVQTERSGRNDVLAEGRKFSGNAFYHNKTNAYHHGTLMVNVDMDKLGRYLSPPKAKLEAKGIASVRSRVVNLSELSPGLTCDKLRRFLETAFAEVYGAKVTALELPPEAMAEIEKTAEHISGWEYLYGAPLPFTFECEARFDWGHILIQLEAKSGIIQGVKVYSDAMDWALPGAIETALNGCRFAPDAFAERLSSALPEYANDLIDMLKSQDI